MTNNELTVQSSLQTANTNVAFNKTASDVTVKTEPQVVQKEQEKSTSVLVQQEQQEQQAQQEQLEKKVAELNDYVQHVNRNLRFSIDEQSGQTVVKVINADTKELVRQIPSQQALDARNAVENYRGLLLETKA